MINIITIITHHHHLQSTIITINHYHHHHHPSSPSTITHHHHQPSPSSPSTITNSTLCVYSVNVSRKFPFCFSVAAIPHPRSHLSWSIAQLPSWPPSSQVLPNLEHPPCSAESCCGLTCIKSQGREPFMPPLSSCTHAHVVSASWLFFPS